MLLLVLTTSVLIYVYKDSIINYAVKEINKYLEAEVKVKKIDLTFWTTFPNVSVDFNQVLINDAFPGQESTDTLIYSELLRLKFNPIDLWNEKYDVKKIVVNNAVVKLRVNRKGEDNYHILKKQKDSTESNFHLSLQAIEMNQLRFLYANQLSESKYQASNATLYLKGDFTQDKFSLETEADFTVKQVKQGLVTFVKNKKSSANVSLYVDNLANSVSISKGKLLFESIPLTFDLNVTKQKLALTVDGNKIPLEKLAQSIQSSQVETIKQLHGSGNANFHLNLTSQLAKDIPPAIQCSFEIENGKIREPMKNLALNNIFLKGNVSTTGELGAEVLSIESVSFSTISGPFSGSLTLRNFSLPNYVGTAKGSVDLEVIQTLFRLPKISVLSGKVNIDSHFILQTLQGNEKHSVEIVDGGGTASLENVSLQLENDSRKFYDVSGNIVMNKNNAVLENLLVRLGESDLQLTGNFNNIDQFLQDENSLDIQVIAESKKINLSDFNNKAAIVENTTTNTQREWILPTKINGSVKFNIDAIHLNQHVFTQISSNMTIGNRTILLDKLHGISANATVNGTLAVLETAPEYFQLATNLSSNDIYFKPIFREWNNFEQQMIDESNISGRAEAILDMKAPFDLRYGILKDEVEAQINMKIIAGQLKNVEAFKTLTKDLKSSKAKLILSKDDIRLLEQKLSNIAFDTLQNTIFIDKGTVFIPKMTIKSNVLAIDLEAKHQFNNQIDYKFSFRFRDLKAKKDESEFGIVEDDGTGFNVFVRMFGKLDNPTIIWDKTSRKDVSQQNREDAKIEAKSILKSEFGLFKKDSTVSKYRPKQQEHEVLQIDFGKDEKVNHYEETKQLEKEKKGLKKLGETFKNQKKEEEEEFSIE